MKQIKLTDRARQDLTNIAVYIAYDNVEKANEFLAKINEAMENLKNFPNMGVNPINYVIPDDYRILLYRNYGVIYYVEDDRIIIYRVVNSAQLYGIIEIE